MKRRRQDASRWELFVRALPIFNASIFKMLSVIMLLSSQQVVASNSTKFKFFSRGDNFPERTFNDPCMQSYPGSYLSVTPIDDKKFAIAQTNNLNEVHHFHLENQLRYKKFFGDVFCDKKLQTLRDKRFEELQDCELENSDYTVDFRDPEIIEIDVINKRARSNYPY